MRLTRSRVEAGCRRARVVFERAAAVVLLTLGLTRVDAQDVANRLLPPGDFAATGGD